MENYISVKKDINLVLIASIMAGSTIVQILRRTLKAYLRDKAEGSKTLMDRAHYFVIDAIWNHSWYLGGLRIAQECLEVSRGLNMLLIIMDLIFLWSLDCIFWSIALDIWTQFLLVIKGETSHGCNLSDRAISRIVRWGVQAIVLLTNVACVVLGERSPLYYNWHEEPMDLQQNLPFFIFRVVQLISAFGTGVVCRIFLRLKFKNKNLSSNQLFSDKMFLCLIPIYVPCLLTVQVAPTQYHKYLLDIITITVKVAILLLPIIVHNNLRNFVFKRIENVDLSIIQYFLWLWRYLFQLMFYPQIIMEKL